MTADASAHPRANHDRGSFGYRLVRLLGGLLMRLLYRVRVSGQAFFPMHGPFILVVNHLHLLDPFAVAPNVPRQVVAMAAAKWRRYLIPRILLNMAGAIFVKRGAVDRQALRASLNVLKEGHILAIAPEGTRSETGTLQRAKAGVAYLALRANVPIVPMVFWGTEHLRDWKRLHRPTLHVVVGKPFRLVKPAGKMTAETLQELSDAVMIQMGQLLPESYRGVYAEQIAMMEQGRLQLDAVLPL